MKPAESYRLAIAARYWKAARLILQNQSRPVEYMEPVGHLLSMAAEIALKSYLVGKGYSDKKLKDKIGHDLEKCVWHAVREGVRLDANDVYCILLMRRTHLSNFYRYGNGANSDGSVKTGAVLLMDEGKALTQVASIISHISDYGARLGAGHGKLLPDDWEVAPPVLQPVNLKAIPTIKVQVKVREKEIADINRKMRERRDGRSGK